MPAPHAACGGLCGPVCGAGMLETAALLHALSQTFRSPTFQHRERCSPQNHKTIPRNVKSGPFIVGLDRPRSSGCLKRRRELCPSRTAAPCLQRGGRVARVGMLSVVRRYPLSGYRAAGWSRPTCVDFPTALPQRDEGKIPGKSVHAFAGGAVGDGYQHGAENAHKSGG
jgi:hypothetical protein